MERRAGWPERSASGWTAGTIRATVLIETIPAAFEMEEILYELREHSAGLNAGRWDYIFCMIKCFRERPEFVLPDRQDVTMTVPFMRAYTELLVQDLPPPRRARDGRDGGGDPVAAPTRRPADRALESVASDKEREAGDGFDGSWVAHPDSVPVAREQFDKVLGERDNQLDRTRDDVDVGAADLLDAVSAAARRASPSRGCAPTSTWASSTSPRGCAATARRPSTA